MAVLLDRRGHVTAARPGERPDRAPRPGGDTAAHGRAADGDTCPRPLDAAASESLRPTARQQLGGRVTHEEARHLDEQTDHHQDHARQDATVDTQGDRHAAGHHPEADEEEHGRTHLTTLGAADTGGIALFGSSWAP